MTLIVLTLLLLLCAPPVAAQTGTLPVLRIDTEDATPVTSKTAYVRGTFYLVDLPGGGGSLGTKENPLGLEIRGRGNSSWKGRKKPYKLRLAEKHAVLGMPKNRHWVLLTYNMATIAGMELGRMLDMAWNAHAQPVEVVLNGDYIGLYLLSENNRIHKNRVNIYKQPDNNDDEATIPYGWLVEVDNYYGKDQIQFRENDQWNINITYHSPDTLSARQRNWLLAEFKDINAAIYAPDKAGSTWEDYLDVGAMARYFIVQEVMDNPDGFHGSFFLHKDLGEGAKWVAGPLWDLNCVRREKTDYTFRMKTSYSFTPHWVGEFVADEDFCQAVRQEWAAFYPEKVDAWMTYLDAQVLPCVQAYASNNVRWPSDYYVPLRDDLAALKVALTDNMAWFDQHLPGLPTGVTMTPTAEAKHYVVCNLQGITLRKAATYDDAVHGLPNGVYIINGTKRLISR